MSFATTDLIVEEGVSDVLRNSGSGLNIVWTFLIALDVGAGAERVSIIPNQPEGAGREN